VACFNSRDYAGFARYYIPDVLLTYPGGAKVVGPEAIVARYLRLHACVRESVELHDLLFDNGRIFCSMYTVFECFADYPGFRWGAFGGLCPGQVARMMDFVPYTPGETQFAAIRIAHHMMHNAPGEPWRRQAHGPLRGGRSAGKLAP
jgi:hypothetical protein